MNYALEGMTAEGKRVLRVAHGERNADRIADEFIKDGLYRRPESTGRGPLQPGEFVVWEM